MTQAASPVSLFVRTLLVVQVFSALATAAYYFLHLQQASVGLEQAFDHHCPAPSLEHGARKGAGIGAYIPYTGNHSLDYIACLMTNFFYILLTPPLRTANIPLILAIPVPWFAILLDAVTLFPRSRLLAIGVPAILGVLIQLKGAGLGFPLYWLFSLTAHVKARAEGRPPARPDNHSLVAAVLGVIIGAVVPSIAMIVQTTFGMTMLWQPFPIYCAIVQALWLAIFSSSKSRKEQYAKRTLPDKNGYWTIQVVYFACAAVATIGHIPFLIAVLRSPSPRAALSNAFSPYPYVYQYPTTEELLLMAPRNEIRRFIQWDAIFIGLSSWLAGAWSWAYADVASLLWAVVSSILCGVVLGPGALLANVYMIQNSRDEEKRIALAGQQQIADATKIKSE